MKRVLVAGATGHLGGFVCQETKTRGQFVRALARSPEKIDRLKDSSDEIVVVFSSIGITRQNDKLSLKTSWPL